MGASVALVWGKQENIGKSRKRRRRRKGREECNYFFMRVKERKVGIKYMNVKGRREEDETERKGDDQDIK